jgi:hypothetical protein
MAAMPVARLPRATNPLARVLDDWLLIGLVLVVAVVQLVTSVSHGHQVVTPYSSAKCRKIFPQLDDVRDVEGRADMARLRSLCETGARLPLEQPSGSRPAPPIRRG